MAISRPGLTGWAFDRLSRGEILTAACPDYPLGWIRSLGAMAPPALWLLGTLPPPPYLGIVGCRDLSWNDLRWAQALGEAAVRLGFTVVSGGARGADSEAAWGAIRAAGSPTTGSMSVRLVEILAGGLRREAPPRPGCRLALAPPSTAFSPALAHERNALIYAMADATVVVRARYREGGTWSGATDALRRRKARVFVQSDPFDPAHRALASLGATPIVDPSELGCLMALGMPGPGTVRAPHHARFVRSSP